MSSRSWQSFDGKIRALKQHLQLSDLALKLANKKAVEFAGNGRKIAEILGGTLDTHMQLNIPNEKTDISRTFITSRNKLHEQAIIELYSVFSSYISSVIAEMEHKQPRRFLSILTGCGDRGINYDDIINIGNYDALIDEMAKRVFRTLENKRSTKELINSVIKITKIDIDAELVDEALLFLEIRHLIIHNDTKADEKFMNMAKREKVSVNTRTHKINLNFVITNEAINAIFRLCKHIDDKLIEKELM